MKRETVKTESHQTTDINTTVILPVWVRRSELWWKWWRAPCFITVSLPLKPTHCGGATQHLHHVEDHWVLFLDAVKRLNIQFISSSERRLRPPDSAFHVGPAAFRRLCVGLCNRSFNSSQRRMMRKQWSRTEKASIHKHETDPADFSWCRFL